MKRDNHYRQDGWPTSFFDGGFEKTFQLLGKYDSTESDVSAILALLDLPSGARILDVPCGWGRHAGALHKRGYNVVGVDLSVAQIARARELWPGIAFHLADMREVPGDDYDAVLNLWTSFGSLPDVADDILALKQWFRCTKAGGFLVMELTTREYAEASNRIGFEDMSRKRVTLNGVTEEAEFDWAKSVSINTYTREDWSRTCVTRLYTRPQLVSMLEDIGYSKVALYGGFAGSPILDDRRTVIVAHKI